MVSAATFHTVATELVMGMFSLASVCITLRLLSALAPEHILADVRRRLDPLTDVTAFVASIGGMAAIPLAILSGLSAAPGGMPVNAYLFNKFLLSGLAFGLWIGFAHSRRVMGSGLWKHRSLALLQGALGLSAFGVTMLVASMGGKVAKGESLLDLMPFEFPLDNSIILPTGSAALMFLLSLVVLLVVIFVQPRPSADHLK